MVGREHQACRRSHRPPGPGKPLPYATSVLAWGSNSCRLTRPTIPNECGRSRRPARGNTFRSTSRATRSAARKTSRSSITSSGYSTSDVNRASTFCTVVAGMVSAGSGAVLDSELTLQPKFFEASGSGQAARRTTIRGGRPPCEREMHLCEMTKGASAFRASRAGQLGLRAEVEVTEARNGQAVHEWLRTNAPRNKACRCLLQQCSKGKSLQPCLGLSKLNSRNSPP